MYRLLLARFGITFLIVSLIFVTALAASGYCQTDTVTTAGKPRSKSMIGLKGGLLFGGKVDIENVDSLSSYEFLAEASSGASFGIVYEFSSPAWTTAGVSLDFHHVEPVGSTDTRWMLDLGVVIKSAVRPARPKFAVRPMLGLSYGRIGGKSGVVGSASLMVVKLGAELLYFPKRGRTGLSLETCIAAAPFGRAFGEGINAGRRYDLAGRIRPLLRLGLVYR